MKITRKIISILFISCLYVNLLVHPISISYQSTNVFLFFDTDDARPLSNDPPAPSED